MALDKFQKVYYQDEMSVPAPNPPKPKARMGTWYWKEKPTARETLAAIYRGAKGDKPTQDTLYEAFSRQEANPQSALYNPYRAPTTKGAVEKLKALGVEAANGVDDDFLFRNQAVGAGVKGLRAAQAYNELLQAEATTKKAEEEWKDLQSELTHISFMGSDTKDTLGKIQWGKYPTLKAMEEGLAQGKPVALNRAVDFSEDNVLGAIWAGRNNGGTGDRQGDSMRYEMEQEHPLRMRDIVEDGYAGEDELAQWLGFPSFEAAKKTAMDKLFQTLKSSLRVPSSPNKDGDFKVQGPAMIKASASQGALPVSQTRIKASGDVSLAPAPRKELPPTHAPGIGEDTSKEEPVGIPQQWPTPSPTSTPSPVIAESQQSAWDCIKEGEAKTQSPQILNFEDAPAYGVAYNNFLPLYSIENYLHDYECRDGDLRFCPSKAWVKSSDSVDGRREVRYDEKQGYVKEGEKFKNMCAKYVSGMLMAGGMEITGEYSKAGVDSIYAELKGTYYKRDGKTYLPSPYVRAVLEISSDGPHSAGGTLTVEEQCKILASMDVVKPGDVVFVAQATKPRDLSHVMMFNRADETGLYYCGETTSSYDEPLTTYTEAVREEGKEPYIEIFLPYHNPDENIPSASLRKELSR